VETPSDPSVDPWAVVAAPSGYDAAKRALDLIVSGAALAVVGIPMLVLMALIRLDSSGPALFRQTRVGLRGREFTCYKLRTMSSDHDPRLHQRYLEYLIEHGDSVVASHLPDREITRLGRVLRRLSLDELPQLVNVFKGDMSIVGPRPPIPYEVAKYRPEHLRRLAVVPGLTGYWQVKGRGRVTFDDMCALDAEYIEKRSMALDLWIIVRTPAAMLKGSG
jgi:lipopolysaccharide/colanic/teichoic acid biosynthesis glycosyltransferase